MKLTYFGHSCFVIEENGFRICLDPYDANVPGYPPLAVAANEVFCSHGHGDHAFTEAVTLEPPVVPNPFRITEIPGFHDDQGGALRGPNTIRIFEANGLRAAHFGDIGCELTAAEKALLTGLDLALIPVGGTFTIDAAGAKALIDVLSPKRVIPMHYRLGEKGYPVIAELSAFTALLPSFTETGSREFELTADTPEGIFVLSI